METKILQPIYATDVLATLIGADLTIVLRSGNTASGTLRAVLADRTLLLGNHLVPFEAIDELIPISPVNFTQFHSPKTYPAVPGPKVKVTAEFAPGFDPDIVAREFAARLPKKDGE